MGSTAKRTAPRFHGSFSQARPASRIVGSLTAALAVLVLSSTAFAGPINVVFTIDPGQSAESWSGSDNTFGAYQAQVGGSLSTPVSGNFVVSFDPSTDTPSTIQFIGNNALNNNGFWQLANSDSAATPFGTPANLAGTTAGGDVQFAIRNLVFSFNSPTISPTTTSGLTQTFTATTTGFAVTSGGIAFKDPGGSGFGTYVGSTGTVTGGTWTLSESAAGSGHWTLGLTGFYNYTYNNGSTTGNFTASGNFVATADYGSNNQASVPTAGSGPVTTDVLGGSSTTDGVTATLPEGSTGGTLSAQVLPGITSLTQAAVTAGENNPVFALSTSDTSIGVPQIWDLQYTGDLNGGTATLVFHFDPSLIPAGTPLSSLGIWHFNKLTDAWEFLTGPIDTVNDTITITTTSFSPFELGRFVSPVPEPSTFVLASFGLLPLAVVVHRRKRRVAAQS